jgi:hypothetical protein
MYILTESQWPRPLRAEKKPPSSLSLFFPSCSSPTSSAILWRVSNISEKSGLRAGSCCQHFWRSSESFACVCFGIVGRNPCGMKHSILDEKDSIQHLYFLFLFTVQRGLKFYICGKEKPWCERIYCHSLILHICSCLSKFYRDMFLELVTYQTSAWFLGIDADSKHMWRFYHGNMWSIGLIERIPLRNIIWTTWTARRKKEVDNFTFCTTPTAACSGVRYS